MDKTRLSSTVLALALLLSAWSPHAYADGVCTLREPTTAESKSYTDSYALFLQVAPKAPDGWTSTDNPATGALPGLCVESGNEPIRRHFDRTFHLERGRKEREDKAVQAYSDMIQSQQAKAAANQAAIDAIDAKINATSVKAQQAATSRRFAEIEPLNQQIDALMKQKTSLMGLGESDAQAAAIEADLNRDTEASFSLWFETPTREPRDGQPYRTAAGQAFLTAYDNHGNPQNDVRVFFAGAPQQARVMVVGDPARMRQLLAATDLEAIAAFK
jgi:hypothetical protein